nr:hypothetical protein [Tanacetum cinerariifolium]
VNLHDHSFKRIIEIHLHEASIDHFTDENGVERHTDS